MFKVSSILPKKVKDLIKNYFLMVRACKKIKPFLSNGIYTIKNKKIIRRFGLPFFIVSNHSGDILINEKTIRLYYKIEGNKIVVFTSDRVFSFYQSEYAINNILKYYDDFNFPKAKLYKISKDNLYTISEFVEGEEFIKKADVLELAKVLLLKCIDSKVYDKPEIYDDIKKDLFPNVTFTIQHGDGFFKNVLKTGDFSYKYIDFDSLGIYPLFYDFFTITIASRSAATEEFFNGYFDDEIQKYIDTKEINIQIKDFKDEVLAAFVKTAWSRLFVDLKLRKYVPVDYPKTRDAMCSRTLMREYKDE